MKRLSVITQFKIEFLLPFTLEKCLEKCLKGFIPESSVRYICHRNFLKNKQIFYSIISCHGLISFSVLNKLYHLLVAF